MESKSSRASRNVLGGILALAVILATGFEAHADRKKPKREPSKEEVAWCETNRKVCQDIGCSHHDAGSDDQKDCWQECADKALQCLEDLERRVAVTGFRTGNFRGVLRQP